jgi:transcriptional regulator with XRE-family HTH domain
MTIGMALRRLREKAGMSQLDLAKRSGVAQGYISELEAGQKDNPTLPTLRKLAAALRVKVTDLIS